MLKTPENLETYHGYKLSGGVLFDYQELNLNGRVHMFVCTNPVLQLKFSIFSAFFSAVF